MWWRRDRELDQEQTKVQQQQEQHDDNLESDRRVRNGPGFWFWVLLGAAAIVSLRRRYWNFERDFGQGNASWSGGLGGSGPNYGSRGSQQYSHAAQEAQRQTFKAHIEEVLRRERIRRMQEAFARAREAYSRGSDPWQRTYDPWQEHQGTSTTWEWRWDGNRWEGHRWEGHPWQGNPWQGNPFEWKGEEDYWKAGSREQQWRTQEESSSAFMNRGQVGHHLAVLGLDANRAQQYTAAEIKAAFRAKAKEYHPDHNRSGSKQAEVKFKEIMDSYQALRAHYKIK